MSLDIDRSGPTKVGPGLLLRFSADDKRCHKQIKAIINKEPQIIKPDIGYILGYR